MWIVFKENLDNKPYLLAVGKSLFLCQKFETTCKDIITKLFMTKAWHEKKFHINEYQRKNDFDDIKVLTSYSQYLFDLFLGKSINYLEKEFNIGLDKLLSIPENELKILKDAKDSRNYICHELTIEFAVANISCSEFQWDIENHINHILNIAQGDYLVSKWSYEFCGKESGEFFSKSNYIQNICDWVFGSSNESNCI